MATRGRIGLPPSFIAAVDQRRDEEGLSIRGLAKKAGVSAPSVIRLRKGEASWDTIERVAGVLRIPLPVLIDPSSPEGRLERLRHTDPDEYRLIARLLAKSDGNAPWPPGKG